MMIRASGDDLDSFRSTALFGDDSGSSFSNLATTMRRILGYRPVRYAVAAMTVLFAIALGTSWYVGGSLVAPSSCVIGDPPQELNASSFVIESESGSTISGWHCRPSESNGVIVLLHGIRGSRLSMLERARMLHDSGYATVMIDLQAHGESPGEAITVGHLEKHDARAAVEFARRKHANEPIGVIGVSLGGAAAVLASPLEIDALVLEAVYSTIDDAIHNRVSAKLGPAAAVPSALLLLQLSPRLGFSAADLRPIDHMPNLACPVCVVSGTADRHTTLAETRSMFDAAAEPKDLWLVEDADHADLFGVDQAAYREKILDFFEQHLRDASALPLPKK